MTSSAPGTTSEAVALEGGATEGDASNAAARNAGRGGVAVLAAKVFFVLSGLVQQTLLPRVIGLAGYGAFSRVLALANIPNNVVVASSTQGVSRAVARAPGHEGEAFRNAMRVHVPLAFVVAVIFAGAGPLFARFEEARHIATPLVLVAVVLLMYGIYAPTIGLLNGRGQFTRQAMLDMTFAVIRTIGLLGVGYALFSRSRRVAGPMGDSDAGVLGATLGFVLAATLIVPIALVMARRSGTQRARPKEASRAGANERPVADARAFHARGYLAELLSLGGAQFFTSALMQVDITLLGRFLSEGAVASGLSGADATRSADEWVAVYRACQLFAFLPYQLLLSITQILFPMVARAKAQNDDAAVQRYVERGARLAAIACGLMVSVVAGIPATLLSFAFTPEVAERGASTLRILALGQGAFTMLGIATSVLASIGRERTAATITAGALLAVGIACEGLTSGAGFGGPQLHATAIATSAALFVTLFVAARTVRGLTGAFLPLSTAVRVALAVAIVVGGGLFVPRFGRLAAPALSVAFAGAYVILLVGMRELTRADSKALRSLRS